MPTVLCGIHCFDVPSLATAGSVARELSASLDPALDGAGCAVEVYRLQPVAPDAPLADGEAVLCRLPAWRFDLAALEGLLTQLEGLRAEHEALQVLHGRTQEALVSLNASIEAGEVAASAAQCEQEGRHEVQLLRQQLAQSERKSQETKATVIALRSEFMHLLDMMQNAGGPTPELPPVMRELDANVMCPSPYYSAYEVDKLGGCSAERAKTARHGPHAALSAGVRRRGASPRAFRSPGNFTTPRPSSRSQGAHQHKGNVGAPLYLRPRQLGEGM